MGKFQDLTGMTFGRLTVIERAENSNNGAARWLCRCSCGNEVVVCASDLKNRQESCGCYRREKASQANKKHGMSGTKIYKTWRDMLARCENPKHKSFDEYGGRGIKVCERWHKFENFYDDVSQLPHFGEKGYTLDRIRVNEDYKPGNVRWSDANTQARNRRNNVMVEYEGVEMCLTEATEKSGISYTTLQSRYHAGDRGDKLFRPSRKKRH